MMQRIFPVFRHLVGLLANCTSLFLASLLAICLTASLLSAVILWIASDKGGFDTRMIALSLTAILIALEVAYAITWPGLFIFLFLSLRLWRKNAPRRFLYVLLGAAVATFDGALFFLLTNMNSDHRLLLSDGYSLLPIFTFTGAMTAFFHWHLLRKITKLDIKPKIEMTPCPYVATTF